MNSILIAVPEIGPETLRDVLLCARESLINALLHRWKNEERRAFIL